jgi:CTD small phosphatase-like protein 2
VEAGINVRPYAVEMLKELSKNFEIIVFTASHSCYANVVLDYLDPTGEMIHHRLFREHCYQSSEGVYIKDLRILGRDLKKVVLVDNAAHSFGFQLDNGVPILPYYFHQDDRELLDLTQYLKSLANVLDVRATNRRTFKLFLHQLATSSENALMRIFPGLPPSSISKVLSARG